MDVHLARTPVRLPVIASAGLVITTAGFGAALAQFGALPVVLWALVAGAIAVGVHRHQDHRRQQALHRLIEHLAATSLWPPVVADDRALDAPSTAAVDADLMPMAARLEDVVRAACVAARDRERADLAHADAERARIAGELTRSEAGADALDAAMNDVRHAARAREAVLAAIVGDTAVAVLDGECAGFVSPALQTLLAALDDDAGTPPLARAIAAASGTHDLIIDGRPFAVQSRDVTVGVNARLTVLTCIDRGREGEAEAAIKAVITAAADGQLDACGDIEPATPFQSWLVANLDVLFTTWGAALDDMTAALQDAAAGDLTRRADAVCYGRLARLRAAANACIDTQRATLLALYDGLDTLGARAHGLGDDGVAAARDGASALAGWAGARERLGRLAGDLDAQTAQVAALHARVTSLTAEHERALHALADARAALATVAAREHDVAAAAETIDAAAFRVKLLAINATIEAAHAGTQGRTFAIVADEMRALAASAATAAEDLRHARDARAAALGDGTALLECATAVHDAATAALASECVEARRIAEGVAQGRAQVARLFSGAQAMERRANRQQAGFDALLEHGTEIGECARELQRSLVATRASQLAVMPHAVVTTLPASLADYIDAAVA